MNKQKLLLATTNQGKIREFKTLLKDLPLNVLTIGDIRSIPREITIEEGRVSFAQNARLKAQTYGELTGLLTLSDDSGLEINALDGQPGVKSKRFGRTNDERIKKVHQLLNNVPYEKKTARFRAVIAIYIPDSKEIILFEGKTEGIIIDESRGKNGFGYDPIFFSLELGKTFAQATAKEKNRVSHRARAIGKAKIFLRKYLSSSKAN